MSAFTEIWNNNDDICFNITEYFASEIATSIHDIQTYMKHVYLHYMAPIKSSVSMFRYGQVTADFTHILQGYFTGVVATIQMPPGSSELTHCRLVTAYGDRDLCQHWLR